MEILERNFAEIAQKIGSNAVIAKGFEEKLWSAELCSKYLGEKYEDMMPHLPALLITNDHPERLNDDSLRLLIPLERAEDEFGDLEAFFRALTEFTKNSGPDFLERFREQKDWIAEGNKLVELKPNFFGIGVNLNEFIRRIKQS